MDQNLLILNNFGGRCCRLSCPHQQRQHGFYCFLPVNRWLAVRLPAEETASTITMHIDKKMLYTLARLARLEIEKGTESQLLEDLNNTLQWADQRKQIGPDEGISGGEPDGGADTPREDVPQLSRPRQTVMNAPEHHNGYITVPLSLNKKIRHAD
jgi:aspartyl/glutamyl-tRNA(Asn/Gln) amidotransferase C subunit